MNGQSSADLIYHLRALGKACCILHIGAHPDDEDIGLMAYLPRKYGVRTVWWSATRGEGGQNRIGPYSGEALGVYRTWESLAARDIDGGEVLFGPFIDYGFSKNGDEAMTRWGRENLVREIVRVIRLVQPHIVIARWQGTAHDGHGHHQAVGQATVEAYEAAGNPQAFPELRGQGLTTWQPLKLFHSSMGDWQPGEEVGFGRRDPSLERPGVIRINTGEFDPIAGQTYQEIAWRAFNQYQTQAMGFKPQPGDFSYYLILHNGRVPPHDNAQTPGQEGLFDGLDPTLAGLADYPGNGSEDLGDVLSALNEWVEKAINHFQAENPSPAASYLLEGLALLRNLRADLANFGLDEDTHTAFAGYLARKEKAFEAVIARCLGLRLTCDSEHARVIPGQRLQVTTRFWNHQANDIDEPRFQLNLPDGWQSDAVDSPHTATNKADATGQSATYAVTVSTTAVLSNPHWLQCAHDPYRYRWPDNRPSTLPFEAAQITAACEVTVNGQRLTLREPALFRESFPGGYRELPPAVIPPVSLHPVATREFLRVKGSGGPGTVESTEDFSNLLDFLRESETDQILTCQVIAQNNGREPFSGKLELIVPEGWKVTPEQIETILEVGGSETASFTLSVPADTPEGIYTLQYKILVGEREYTDELTAVRMAYPGLTAVDRSNCLRERFIVSPAQVAVHLIDTQFSPELRYAYVQGADEAVVQSLKAFGVEFHLIGDDELGHVDLDQFDAIVIGPNAYLIRDEMRKYAERFLLYTAQGGTLIVQYQAYGYQDNNFTPYPFRYNQPHDRVTLPDAPVDILAGDHRLFKRPNVIQAADFDHWVRDRGLYFWGEWADPYQPLLASADPGETPKEGGLLICPYGEGTYVYCAYSFFRQLPAAVPGAFRLFANLLSLPATRIQERIAFLQRTSLFSSLQDEQLRPLAESMAEQQMENGTIIARQGEFGHDLYIVYRGEVEVFQTIDGQEQPVDVAREGSCLGELAVLGNVARTATLRARGDVFLYTLAETQFQMLLQQHPAVAIEIIKLITERYFGTR